MLTRGEVQLFTSLKHKKFRTSHQLFVVEGEKPVKELLVSKLRVKYVLTLQDVAADFQQLCPNGVRFETADFKTLEKISSLASPPPVLAIAEIPSELISKDVTLQPWNLYLAGIRDPGNLGTMIRLADWYGLKHIYCSDDTVETFNPKTIQSAMGSLFRVSVVRGDIPQETQAILLGADLSGTSVYKFPFNTQNKYILLVGSESHGIPENYRNEVQEFIMIPGHGQAESLNAAMAAGIITDNYFRNLAP